MTWLLIFVLSAFLGLELISKVPSQLHTPLMSGSNAVSGITVLGALTLAGSAPPGTWMSVVAGIAVGLAAVNVVGGYLVTDRMLAMFKTGKKD